MNASKRLSDYLYTGARLIFGTWFLFAGLNYWLPLVPQPYGTNAQSKTFIDSLISSGIFNLVKAVELIMGLMILANRFVALAVIAVTPIVIVATYFCIILEHSPRSLVIGTATLAVYLLLAVHNFDSYKPLLASRTTNEEST